MKKLEVNNKEMIIEAIQHYFEHNEEAKFVHRLHGVLLFIGKEGESCDSVGALFGHSPRTVSNWIKKVIRTGNIDALREKNHPGRPSRLSAEQKNELKQVLQKSPDESGVPCNLWDGKSLSLYIEERYGVQLKVRACQNLFHELGFSLKRARPVVSKGDDEKKEVSKKTSRENSDRQL